LRPFFAGALLVSIVQKEGVGALFKGALARALWVAPVGALNFAGEHDENGGRIDVDVCCKANHTHVQ